MCIALTIDCANFGSHSLGGFACFPKGKEEDPVQGKSEKEGKLRNE